MKNWTTERFFEYSLTGCVVTEWAGPGEQVGEPLIHCDCLPEQSHLHTGDFDTQTLIV